MRYLKNYGNFSINEANEAESIFIKNKGMSKDEEIAFLNDILTYINKTEKISDIAENKVRIKNGDKIVVDRRGKNVLFKYKQDADEKIKVFIKTDLFVNNKKDDIIKALVSKGATAPLAPVTPTSNTQTTSAPVADKPKSIAQTQTVNWADFNKKWVTVLGAIKKSLSVPILKVANMNQLFSSYKNYVLFVQEFLNLNNGSKLDLDGKVGNNTSGEIKKFQEAKSINADGICGPLTWEKITEVIGQPITGLKVISAPGKSSTTKNGVTPTPTVSAPAQSGLNIKADVKILRKITEMASVNFPDEDLDIMAKSADCTIDNDDYNDIFGYFRYYAIDTFTDFNESGWLNLFKKMNSNDLLYFVYHYNNTPHFFQGETIKFDFATDCKEALDENEMSELSSILEEKGIKITDGVVSKNGKSVIA